MMRDEAGGSAGDADARPRTLPRTGMAEMLFTVVMAVAAIATAWAGFESSQWGGEQARFRNQASTARVDANRWANEAAQLRTLDVVTFTQWLNALNTEIQTDPTAYPEHGYTPNPRRASGFIYERFRSEFKPAFDAWTATHPLSNPEAPKTPFVMPEYQLASQHKAKALIAEAAAKDTKARAAKAISNHYVLMTVMLALVLFFTALGSKANGRFSRIGLFGLGVMILIGTLVTMGTFPIAF